MGRKCSLCGKNVGLMEPFSNKRYTYHGNVMNFGFCGDCYPKIMALEKGEITLPEIMTNNTEIQLVDYYRCVIDEDPEVMTEEEHSKLQAQKTDPLYDDIHQIATDLRFIKNYLVICIIIGAILGLISIVSLF